jgi:PPOX class probable FMN-dependent enzyme
MSRDLEQEPYHWSEALKRAVRRNRRDAHNRYLQLATLREDGTPAVRSLVFREFCDLSLELRMVTDRRSAKVGEIEACPRGEISWYLTHTREQFRLRGHLRLEGADASSQHARRKLWNSLSEKAREQFYWPHPGQPLADAKPGGAVGREVSAEDAPPGNFLLLALAVEEVDHLTLRGDPQTRVISRRDDRGAWLSEAVNP